MPASPVLVSPEETPAQRRRAIAYGAVILLATFLAYMPALRANYIWDDDAYLTQNVLVQTWRGLPNIWLTTQTPQYYPLVFTSFWIEHKLWGLNPLGYHAVNVLLHALNAILVWRIAKRLGLPAAWLIGLIFALHPVEVESVAWVTERKNVLSGLFYLLAFRSYLQFEQVGRPRWYAAAVAFFLAALLSKTVTATLPVVILLALFYLAKGRLAPRRAFNLAPLLGIGAAMGLWTAHLERVKVGAVGEEWNQTLFERATIVAPSAYAFYAGKVLWPEPLIFIYPRWHIDASRWTSYLPLAGVLAALAVTLLGIRRWGWGPLLLLIFSGVTLFPALGFLNVYPHRFSFVADHFQYLGSLGFIILYVLIVRAGLRRWIPQTPRTVLSAAGAAAACAMLGALTFRQGFHYADAARLWEDTLAANPEAWIGMINLGKERLNEGRYDEAIQFFERAERTHPFARLEAYGCWSDALFRQGKYEETVQKCRQFLELQPRDAVMQGSLGVALQRLGRLDEAERALQTAVEISPTYQSGWKNLALLRALQERWEEALPCLAEALKLNPRNVEIRMLHGDTLAKLGRYAEAEQAYQAVLAMAPDHADAPAALARVRAERGHSAETAPPGRP